ncbi:hypothetical protein [Rhizobium sp. SL86]|uniref:hypothetical protein n=1 Tax=Rhizobium sp. SL86 TaxID=2995148 RepID=UPI002274FF8A|nr:hypothetical protein [Rhizobium sp. SL86]MCY1665681.1 hypothetical protein [Rhizobium sp. SL86]
MMAKALKSGMLAAFLLALAADMSAAGDRNVFSGRDSGWHGRSHDGRSRDHHWRGNARDRLAQDRHERRDRSFRSAQQVIGTDGLPSVIPGVGTFSGGISAVRIKGNGIFFAGEGGLLSVPDIDRLNPSAKIISVDEDVASNAFLPHEACEYEAGVCVIRGSR